MAFSLLIVIFLLFGLCLCSLIIYIAIESRNRKSVVDSFDVLGMIAKVNTRLEPEGAVILNGELWRARTKRSMSSVIAGQPVRVVGASGHLLLVEPTE